MERIPRSYQWSTSVVTERNRTRARSQSKDNKAVIWLSLAQLKKTMYFEFDKLQKYLTPLNILQDTSVKVDDIIDPKAYSIEETKQKSEHDRLVELAERKKAETRQKVAELKDRLRKLKEQNNRLPERIRLPTEAFNLVPQIRCDLLKDRETEIDLVYRETAWETEKNRLALEKLENVFIKPLDCDRITVKAFCSGHCVTSIRMNKLSEEHIKVYDEIISIREKSLSKEKEDTVKHYTQLGSIYVVIENTGYEDIMGRNGLGERNESGERFANLCAFKKLVISGTIFPHKRIHKATWISPDHTTENQIDYICINKKFQRTMEDVRTKRGAEIASNHHLVVANLKLKLEKNWTTGQTATQRFNTALLRDTDRLNEFKIALKNRFQDLEDLLKEEETTMEDNWKGIKEALTSTLVDWIVKTSTSERKHGIQWTAQNQLDDLDFADDLAILSHKHEQMQIKTVSVAAVSASIKNVTNQVHTSIKGARGLRIAQKLHLLEESRRKRDARRAQWKQLEAMKPADDYEDPRDMKEIQLAKEKIGDYKLKSATNYVIPESMKLNTFEVKHKLLNLVDHVSQYVVIHEFNVSLIGLRNKKMKIIENLKKIDKQLKYINCNLPLNEYGIRLHIDELDEDEYPERYY
ncbi:unnamed protein product [Schistosoma mattheei]|uniref:Uncharacterized protein n=1 Tax=Schistosoma mattheei TaxID=31246 RepID=A0A183P3C7_9TREM|nr:unnamed protein product [Schistosoma mattheei]